MESRELIQSLPSLTLFVSMATLLLWMAAPALAQTPAVSLSPVITTVAGSGTAGHGGDGGAATSAGLSASGVAVDAVGNLYIADSGNSRIRKVDAVMGIITTVAGNGIAGYSGDGGAATSAQLSPHLQGIVVDAAGNLYIADAGNNRIRKVTAATGVIITVAGNGTTGYSGDGGAATSAELGNSYGVAVDAAGNLYIADNGNSRIRKVDAVTSIITTVAGNGIAGYTGDGGAATSAELDHPQGVGVDAAGNLYIVDNDRIRKVNAATGAITTVAGSGIAGYSGDGGAATSASLFLSGTQGSNPLVLRWTRPATSTSRTNSMIASAR